MNRIVLSLIIGLYNISANAQMVNGLDTLYGNEWINFEQSYFKIPVVNDGIFRIDASTMTAAGIPSTISTEQLQLFYLGQEVPIYTSTNGTLQAGDFIEFYGQKNRAQVDQYLFADPDAELLNPYYSLFTDTSAYYLTWTDSPGNVRFVVQPNVLNNLPEPEAWFWHEQQLVYSNTAIHRTNLEGVSESTFDTGEGFGTAYSNDHSFTISPKAVAAVTNSSQLQVRMASSHGVSHQLQLSINGTLAVEETWSGVALKQYVIDQPTATLNNDLGIGIQGLAPNNDRYSVAHITLIYPHTFDFDNTQSFAFSISGSNNDRFLEIENFNANNGSPILYDLTNRLRLEGLIEDGVIKFKLPASFEQRQMILVNSNSGVQTVSGISPVSFIDYTNVSGDYIFISNKKLYNDGQGNNPVQNYADYRASANGGGFSPLVVDIAQLYEQFAYGLQRHPIAIRNFAYYLNRHWQSPPRYFMLLGKAREYDKVRTASQLTNDGNRTFYIPTYGRPGSDNLLFGTVSSSQPIVSVGRLAAETPNDITIYLNKVKDFEANAQASTQADRIWRKKAIHLGGGGSVAEQNSIRSALEQMGERLKNNSVGADIFSFYKTSSDPIQQSQSDQITQRINEGVGIVTFFGHSGTGGFDFSIDDPSTYQNKDRYPVMFSLGCLSGQIHSSIRSVGENFIFQKDKGAIAFFASVGLGYIPPLNAVANTYYNLLGSDYYTESIGDIFRNTLSIFNNAQGIPNRSLSQQFTLHGDPAIVLHPVNAPDFTPLSTSVQFQPEVINAQLDSFNFIFDVLNIGKNTNDSVWIEIGREFPNGARVTVLRQKVAAPKYRTTFQYRLPVQGEQAIGFNRYFVEVDPDNLIDELPAAVAEQNNRLRDDTNQPGVPIYIFANGTSTIYPVDYGILTSDNPALRASTADPFAPAQNYVFELDTTVFFNSAVKNRTVINQKGGVLSWSLNNINLTDSTVYYWRVSQDSTAAFGYVWDQSSFLYLEESPSGWHQSHFYQLTENQFDNTEMDTASRSLKYLDDVKTFRVKNGVYPDVWPEIAVNNDSYLYIPWDNATPGGLMICVIDPVSGDPWINPPPGAYGSNLQTPWAQNWPVFPYDTRSIQSRERAINFLKDTVPSGHYVLIYSIQQPNRSYEPWEWAADSTTLGTNLLQVLEAQGATIPRILAENNLTLPYIFFYKKDDPSQSPVEQLGNETNTITDAFYINGTWDNGSIRSVRIGPAQAWHSFHQQLSQIDPLDEYSFDVYGIRSDSTQTPLFTNTQASSLDLSAIDAQLYPHLQLRFKSADTLLRSAPQLDYWRVLYDGIPEAAVAPNAFYEFHQDTLQQGDPLRLRLGVANLDNYDMDSLLIRYSISDPFNNTQQVDQRYRPLPKADTLIADFSFNTFEMEGEQQLIVEINPVEDQPERLHFNNVGYQRFFVKKDRRNPVLDVTFDGAYIMNGDLVSPQPHIVIRLKDENPYLALSDTAVLRVFLKYPNATDVVAIPYATSALQFFPAQSGDLNGNNQAMLEFSPQLEENGRYTLIVQGQDATGNSSGLYDYKVDFEVILEKQLSNVFNYPNPFSTSTRFVYTLTGSEPPAIFTIQIMTISGRVVRELTQADLGPLRIGTHRTEFDWDGTDEFGDRLANGVYLYRVLVNDADGNAYEKYDTGTDRFFKNDIGKLVILR